LRRRRCLRRRLALGERHREPRDHPGESPMIARLVAVLVGAILISGTSASAAGQPYRSRIFDPAFSAVLPVGWTVAERDPSGVQFFKPCRTCLEGGEENGEVTLDMALAHAT